MHVKESVCVEILVNMAAHTIPLGMLRKSFRNESGVNWHLEVRFDHECVTCFLDTAVIPKGKLGPLLTEKKPQ